MAENGFQRRLRVEVVDHNIGVSTPTRLRITAQIPFARWTRRAALGDAFGFLSLTSSAIFSTRTRLVHLMGIFGDDDAALTRLAISLNVVAGTNVNDHAMGFW